MDQNFNNGNGGLETMLIHLHRIEIEYRGFKTALSVMVDKQNHIHLLDLDEEGTKSLTNAIDAGFQLKVLDEIKKTHNLDFKVAKWFCYHSDGYVTEWDGVFRHVPHIDSMLYDPFTEVATERREEILAGRR